MHLHFISFFWFTFTSHPQIIKLTVNIRVDLDISSVLDKSSVVYNFVSLITKVRHQFESLTSLSLICFCKTYFNVIHPSISTSRRFLLSILSNLQFPHILWPPCVVHLSLPSWFDNCHNISRRKWIMRASNSAMFQVLKYLLQVKVKSFRLVIFVTTRMSYSTNVIVSLALVSSSLMNTMFEEVGH
jgi:hypothetical protein